MNRPEIRNRRALCLLPGFLIFILALVAFCLHRPDRWLTSLAWTLAVGGFSVALLGATWRTHWQQSVGLLALALVGQACTLQLVFAPPYGV